RWRALAVEGASTDWQRALATRFARVQSNGIEHHVHVEPLGLPRSLAPVVAGVFGLDNRPRGEAHVRVRAEPDALERALAIADAAERYGFPAGLDGSGVTIGIAQFGGVFHAGDFAAAMAHARVVRRDVEHRSVDGTHHRGALNAGCEVALDTQLAGALAPGAQFVCYDAPNEDRGYIDGIAAALTDFERAPTIVSISFGVPEHALSASARHVLDELLAVAALIGICVVASSGDHGIDALGSVHRAVNYPAASPFVLACGGTQLEFDHRRVVSERVWHDGEFAAGGGFSAHHAVPAWQTNAPGIARDYGERAGRGVPDVAAQAAPGYRIVHDGRMVVMGGTSAAAPVWAALLACIQQRLGSPLGLVAPHLYDPAPAMPFFRDITSGTNGHYHARRGWDPCTGLGTPDGAALLAALAGSA
ncbi:MAG: S53 family peptidase, partial [Candidatus Dormibacteria bacterium]